MVNIPWVSMKYPTLAKYCIMLSVVKCCDLMHFLSFPGKLLQLPVTLPISGMLYNNIHGKTCAVRKQSAKTMKLLPQNKINITVSWDYKNTSTIQRCILWLGILTRQSMLAFQRSTVARGTAYVQSILRIARIRVMFLWQHYVNDGHILANRSCKVKHFPWFISPLHVP